MSGDGKDGTLGNISGKAWRIAQALSKATKPNTIKVFVTKKNKASLYGVRKPRAVEA
jgi:hypothetical protein